MSEEEWTGTGETLIDVSELQATTPWDGTVVAYGVQTDPWPPVYPAPQTYPTTGFGVYLTIDDEPRVKRLRAKIREMKASGETLESAGKKVAGRLLKEWAEKLLQELGA